MHICVSMLICLYITKVFYSNAVRMDKIFIYEVVCLLINWLIRQSRLQRTAGVVCESGIHLNCGSCSEFYSLVDSCLLNAAGRRAAVSSVHQSGCIMLFWSVLCLKFVVEFAAGVREMCGVFLLNVFTV